MFPPGFGFLTFCLFLFYERVERFRRVMREAFVCRWMSISEGVVRFIARTISIGKGRLAYLSVSKCDKKFRAATVS
ncbi:hypothetical protein CEXT_782251 [Caerostris extrusa]|uniref:Secreted protein n=1 Tax=Caerostris extrusa TaxID=172846 RepID=A0AAV4SSJ9_CAEEX|nr:hypothetical protein CEXT_782251 [Caerostris extrusa]